MKAPIVALVCLCVAACGNKPKRKVYDYAILFPDEAKAAVLGAHVFAGDRELGVVDEPSGHRVGVRFDLKREEQLHTMGPIVMRFMTPCGPRTIPLTFENEITAEWEKSRREIAFDTNPVVFHSEPPASAPSTSEIWVDYGVDDAKAVKERVSIGEAQLDVVTDGPTEFYGLDCAPAHTVKVGGTVVGKVTVGKILEAVGAPPEELERQQSKIDEFSRPSLFVSAKNGICHRWREVRYEASDDGFAPKPTLLGAAQRLYIFRRSPYFFLREASEAIEVEADTAFFGNTLGELLRVPCS